MEDDELRAMLWELQQVEGNAWDTIEAVGLLRNRMREELERRKEEREA